MHELLHFVPSSLDDAEGTPLTGPRAYHRIEDGELEGKAELNWSGPLLEELARLRRRGDEGAREALGERLRAFLQEARWEADEDVLDRLAEGEEAILTLRSQAPELYLLPWELTHVRRRGPALHMRDEVVLRHELLGLPPLGRRAPPDRPILAFAWCAGVPAQLVEAQRAALRGACTGTGVELVERGPVDLAGLRALVSGATALHLLAHGSGGDAERPPALHLDPAHPEQDLTPSRLQGLLQGHDLHLLTLMACEGGDAATASLRFGSLAQAAQQADVPNVIASRWPLSMAAATPLSEALYGALLREGVSLERAMSRARRALLDRGAEADAFALQLYGRAFVEERRPDGARLSMEVVASRPFGERRAAAAMGSRSEAALARLTLEGLLAELDTPAARERLRAVLAELSGDAGLRIEGVAAGSVVLDLRLHPDALQHLFNALRAGRLEQALGRRVLGLRRLDGVGAPPSHRPAPRDAMRGAPPPDPGSDDPPPRRLPRRLWLWIIGGLLFVFVMLSGGLILTPKGILLVGPDGLPPEFKERFQRPPPEAETSPATEIVDQSVKNDTEASTDGTQAAPPTVETPPAGPPPCVPQAETCDGRDEDCDGRADEGLRVREVFVDKDGDGFGGASQGLTCRAVSRGQVERSGDCDDGDPGINPGAREAADGKDNDCDGQADEGLDRSKPTLADCQGDVKAISGTSGQRPTSTALGNCQRAVRLAQSGQSPGDIQAKPKGDQLIWTLTGSGGEKATCSCRISP